MPRKAHGFSLVELLVVMALVLILYAAMYGPTRGDAVRLGDTSLLAEIEHDYAVPGDESLHGGGKTLRDGMGLKSGYDSADGALDMLICNATIIDPVIGIVKGDIGIKDGRIAPIGKAGTRKS
jgi:urease subunit alpha